MNALLVLTWLAPLAAALIAPSMRFWWLPAVAPLPALAASILVPAGYRFEIPWLLLGATLGLDEPGRIFLTFTAILWLAAGLYASGRMRHGPNAGRFRGLFLLAMAGNLWLIVGLDLASFYVGFSVMGLASYGLVIHAGDRSALRAGKVYLVLTLLGELALFVALVLIASHTGGLMPERADLVGLGDAAIGLLILGLAIKAGLVPLHVWLPLAHPAAPVPASAVLSGAMIKVALLGWLRYLPVGETPLTEWGLLLLAVGTATLFFAIPIGLVQSNPKVILAYSSVSKMGLLVLTLGLILVEPALATAGVLALSVYAAHHALVKGGLFLSVGMRQQAGLQALVLAGTVVLALSLAGVPASGGAVAKYGIKPVLEGTGWSWVSAAVTLSTVGTALLMARFLWVIWFVRAQPVAQGRLLAVAGWTSLLLLTLAYSLLLGSPAAWTTDAWPIGIALVLLLPVTLVAWRRPRLLRPAVGTVPPGDLLGLARPPLAALGLAFRALARAWERLLGSGSTQLAAATQAASLLPREAKDRRRNWSSAGAAWLAVSVLLLAALLWSTPESTSREPPPVAIAEPLPPSPTNERAGTAATDLAKPPADEPRVGGDPVENDAATVDVAVTTPTVAVNDSPALVEPEPSRPATDIAVAVEPAPPPCDPADAFLFGHPAVDRALRLERCIEGTDGPRRLTAPPLTNPLVDLVQRHLNDLGYEAGAVDGLIGPRTRAAIRRFQRDEGSRETGAVDFALLERLRAAAIDSGNRDVDLRTRTPRPSIEISEP